MIICVYFCEEIQMSTDIFRSRAQEQHVIGTLHYKFAINTYLDASTPKQVSQEANVS